MSVHRSCVLCVHVRCVCCMCSMCVSSPLNVRVHVQVCVCVPSLCTYVCACLCASGRSSQCVCACARCVHVCMCAHQLLYLGACVYTVCFSPTPTVFPLFSHCFVCGELETTAANLLLLGLGWKGLVNA